MNQPFLRMKLTRVRIPRVSHTLRGKVAGEAQKRLHFSSAYGNVDLWNTLESRGVKAL
jgi:hypothetical protein